MMLTNQVTLLLCLQCFLMPQKVYQYKMLLTITDKNKAALADFAQIATIRDLRDVKARFVLTDRKEVLFMLMDDTDVHPTYDVGVWLNTPYFSSALAELFELAWKSAKEIKVKA